RWSGCSTECSRATESESEVFCSGKSYSRNGGAQNRAGNANASQGKLVKCYNCNGVRHIARNCTQPKRPQNSDYFKDKMLLMQAQKNGAVLDEEELLFLADSCDLSSRVNSSFENHMKVDGRTKNVLFHSWMNGSWNKRRMDNNIFNNKEWKESDYGNPLNTATDSFFKAYDEHDIEEGNELRQMKRKEDNKNDEQPNKRVCKAEKFEAIKYSLAPNE
ncbi:ATP-dependent RNA helicase DEAH11, chloroplastic-like protein, partial [Tanacetum coccineum]